MAAIGPSSKWAYHHRDLILVVTLKPGKRVPLSPLGSPPKQISCVTLPMGHGRDKLILPAMYNSFQEWRHRQLGQV